MVVLRSRAVSLPEPAPKPLPKISSPEPATPAQSREPSVVQFPPSPSSNPQTPQSGPDSAAPIRRRSCRFALQSDFYDGSIGNSVSGWSIKGEIRDRELGVLSLRSGKIVAKRGEGEKGDFRGNGSGRGKRKRGFASEATLIDDGVKESEVEKMGKSRGSEDEKLETSLASEDGIILSSGEEKWKGKRNLLDHDAGSVLIGEDKMEIEMEGKLEENPNITDYRVLRGRKRHNAKEKGKGKLVDDGIGYLPQVNVEDLEGKVEENQVTGGCKVATRRRSYSGEYKGKGKLVDDDASLANGNACLPMAVNCTTIDFTQSLDLKSKILEIVDSCSDGVSLGYKADVSDEKLELKTKLRDFVESLLDSAAWQSKLKEFDLNLVGNSLDEGSIKEFVRSMMESMQLEDRKEGKKANTGVSGSRMEQFRDIARQNASRFAHFDIQENGEEHLSHEVNAEIPIVEDNQNVEDWPGPFSTAMKIIRDREKKFNSSQGPSSSKKTKYAPITWIPKNYKGDRRPKSLVPSLKELSMRILVKNADAITSLGSVPDTLRHRLCQLLCDSRSFNGHFLGLLVSGSPTEIRIKDCSWLAEEEFTNCFRQCDTNSLMVLQLDNCGRCLPDYVILATLARSPNLLPILTTLSVSGACRLSDIGISSLVSSAPSLKSLNISRCSLLTPTSIWSLATSLGSVLRELYIDDCQNLDAMLILPALKKLEHLEVLSVSAIQTVSDEFLTEFLVARGQNIKELVLADCVKLTDFSVKVIAETCPGLYALNLVNLRKLSDSALGYLANGCQEIQMFKLCRNAFSDEAVAAFLESCGEHINELSLNNVKKVGHNTALSLSRRSRMLQSLDLSWCRNLTDEAVGLIVDSCLSLRILKLFGCSQITNVFLDGHSNPEVKIIGLKMSPVLEHIPCQHEFPLRY